MSSSRLPGKILKDIEGRPMIDHVVERVRMAKTVDLAVVATTVDLSDDPVEQHCRERGFPVYRGSLFDVLDRYYRAAQEFQAGVIVRVTADCPLIDPLVIDKTVLAFFEEGADFAANRLPPPWKRTYPIGLDTEVCSFQALERAWKEASEDHEREHVMPYLYAVPGRFKVKVVDAEMDYGHLRWTVDTPEDLIAVRGLMRLLQGKKEYSWRDVLALWLAHPELEKINAGVEHKKFNDVDGRFDVDP
jgi:spore coat polysaccharide biosynthesis protein SpsF